MPDAKKSIHVIFIGFVGLSARARYLAYVLLPAVALFVALARGEAWKRRQEAR